MYFACKRSMFTRFVLMIKIDEKKILILYKWISDVNRRRKKLDQNAKIMKIWWTKHFIFIFNKAKLRLGNASVKCTGLEHSTTISL
jgi:hypothetical protein